MTGTRGFALAEVIVATVLLTVGVLALEGTALAVERMVAAGQQLGGVAAAAASRLETLRAAGCAAAGDGTASDGRYDVSWSASAAGSLRAVSLTVRYADGRGVRTELVEAVAWCP